MILDHLLPVFLLIALGAVLRRAGLVDPTFLRAADRLIYYVFFPILLFWKIGGTPTDAALPVVLWVGGVVPLLVVFGLSLAAIAALGMERFQAGAFSQATYRFNTYVAIAVVGNVLGDAGVQRLGELLGLAIPVANVLAVMTLIWFSRQQLDQRQRVRLTLRALISNPLILACVAGMVWARVGPALPVAVDNTLRLAASITLPLALISIGGSLSLASARGHLAPSLLATALKILVLPAVGYVLLRAMGAGPDDLLIGMLFLAMPASTAMYVLATQLDSDASLSAAIIVVSTVLSFLSLSAVLVVFT